MTRQAICFAWATFKKHALLLLAISLTFFGAWVVLEIVVIAGQQLGILWWLVAHLAFLIFFAGLQVGFIQICFALYAGETPAYADVFQQLPDGFKFLVGQLLYGLLIFAGLICFIVPGLYLAARYAFVGFYQAVGTESLRESFKESTALSQGRKIYLLTVILALLAFNVIGACLLGVGIFVTMPLSTLMMVSIYKQRSALMHENT